MTWRLPGFQGILGADIVMELVGRHDQLIEGIDMLSNGGTFVETGDIIPGPAVPIRPVETARQ